MSTRLEGGRSWIWWTACALFAIFATLAASSTVNAGAGTNASANCPTLTSDNSGVAGAKGFISFDCSTAGASGLSPLAAFSTGRSVAAVAPLFHLGTGYTDLYIYRVTNASYVVPTASLVSCGGINGAIILVSGKPLTLQGPSSFDYCADYGAAASFPLGSFVITWAVAG
jgi:hypothetical protein